MDTLVDFQKIEGREKSDARKNYPFCSHYSNNCVRTPQGLSRAMSCEKCNINMRGWTYRFSMDSKQMKVHGERTAQPEFVAHAACLAEREQLDALGDETMAISNAIQGKAHVPADLQARVRRVALYLLTGAWWYGDFPEDGITAEADRLKRELASQRASVAQGQPLQE
jgi:hypothetical protein